MGRQRLLMMVVGREREQTAHLGIGGEEMLKGHKCLMTEILKVN